MGSKPGKCGALKEFMPTPDEVTRAITVHEEAMTEVATCVVQHTTSDEPHAQAIYPLAPNTKLIPVPEPLSSQKHSETWRDYFSRMMQKQEQRLATESENA